MIQSEIPLHSAACNSDNPVVIFYELEAWACRQMDFAGRRLCSLFLGAVSDMTY